MSYPLNVYSFRMEAGLSNVSFQEISGLEIGGEAIEYRFSASPESSSIFMPGRRTFGDLTAKRGIFAQDDEALKWIMTANHNDVERRDITISMLNSNQDPVCVWKVKNAWPMKMTGPSLNATGNEVAVEELTFKHEGFTVEFPSAS